jgi:hypothetical protein
MDSESHDRRVADAERFVADIEELVADAASAGGPPRLDRIDGTDRTGTAWAVVDLMGRYVDVGLDPGWWNALGLSRVGDGLLEALESARMKASLAILVMQRSGVRPAELRLDTGGDQRLAPLPRPDDPGFDAAVRGRLDDAQRTLDEVDRLLRGEDEERVVSGPRDLFRLYVRGRHVDRVQVEQWSIGEDDTDRLVADARAAFGELARGRGTADARGQRHEW